MKILHVITGLQTGGAERAFCRLVETLDADSFEHHALVLGEHAALSARAGRACASLCHLNISALGSASLALPKLRGVRARTRCDIVHGWMYHANIAARLALIGRNTPLIWGIRQSLQNLKNEKRATRAVIRLGARMSARPQAIVYNSSASAAQHTALGFCQSNRLTIPNGFDTARYKPSCPARRHVRTQLNITHDALVIGLVARFHPMKDHANFFRAAALLAERRLDSIFVLVGEGLDSNNREVARWIESGGLAARVRLCGRRTDIAQINAALDIATSCSAWGDAFPNALGEAMASAVPCVATDVGDARAIVADTGQIVPVRDAAALARGWANIAALGADGRARLGARARRRIQDHYRLEGVASQYAALYQRLVNSSQCVA